MYKSITVSYNIILGRGGKESMGDRGGGIHYET